MSAGCGRAAQLRGQVEPAGLPWPSSLDLAWPLLLVEKPELTHISKFRSTGRPQPKFA